MKGDIIMYFENTTKMIRKLCGYLGLFVAIFCCILPCMFGCIETTGVPVLLITSVILVITSMLLIISGLSGKVKNYE